MGHMVQDIPPQSHPQPPRPLLLPLLPSTPPLPPRPHHKEFLPHHPLTPHPLLGRRDIHPHRRPRGYQTIGHPCVTGPIGI